MTLWTAACQASLSFTISQSLLKLKSIESVMPSNHRILLSPSPAFNLSQHQVFSKELALPIRWSFNFSISPSNEYSGLISCRIDWFGLLAVQGALKESSPASQFERINSLVLSLLYGPSLTSMHDYWKKKKLWLYGPLSAKWCLSFLICCLVLS